GDRIPPPPRRGPRSPALSDRRGARPRQCLADLLPVSARQAPRRQNQTAPGPRRGLQLEPGPQKQGPRSAALATPAGTGAGWRSSPLRHVDILELPSDRISWSGPLRCDAAASSNTGANEQPTTTP